ncbi:MAG: hydrophobe/amphiphile efflux-3 (HAE3) family transporter, partial [Euryarchaeota archaeon]|nr:hydrophobe/amphiphile efflux-3 (HAE3) family transporter [Euryarchaeota archaeon]
MNVKKQIRKLANLQEKYPVLILLIVLIITAVMADGMLQVRLDPAFEGMLAEDTDCVLTQNLLSSEFGSTDIMLLLIELDYDCDEPNAVTDIRDPQVAEYINTLSKSIAAEKNIESVSSFVDILKAANNGEIPTDPAMIREIAEEEASRRFVNREYSSTVLYIDANINGDMDLLEDLEKEIYNDIDQTPTPTGIKVIISGVPSTMNLIMSLIASDLLVTMAFSMIFVWLILWRLLKHPVTAILSLIPVFVSVIWTAGSMAHLGIELASITVGLGAMIIGMGIDYSIHITHRFFELLREDHDFPLAESVSTIAPPLFASAATTMAGFIAMAFGKMSMNAKMGFLLTTGIAYAFLAVLIILPPLLVLERRYMGTAFKHTCVLTACGAGSAGRAGGANGTGSNGIVRNALKGLALFQTRSPVLVIVIAIALTAAIAPFATQSRLDESSENWIPEDCAIIEAFQSMWSDYSGTDAVTVAITLDNAGTVSDLADPAVLRSVHRLAMVFRATEIVETVDSATFAMITANGGHLPQTHYTSKKIIEENPGIRSNFNRDYSVMRFDVAGTSIEAVDMPVIEQEVGTVLFPDGVSVHLAGIGVMDAANREQMEAEMGFTTIIGFILVFVVASLFYRSALVGLIALTPIILALVWTISTMGLIDLPFTGLSVTIFTMVMGIGIDYSIHLVHRIKEERISHKIEDAVMIAVMNVGDSLFSATATTTVCFASLTFASLLAVDRLGRTLSLGVIFCFFAALFMVPAILVIEDR